MASQTLTQRTTTKDDPTTTTTNTNNNNNNLRSSSDGGGARDKQMAMAKRGLRSLGIAIATPVLLTLITIFLFGSGENYHNVEKNKPLWYPPLWGLHLACVISSILMGLSTWLVWADGGFHKQPSVVPLYLGQLLLSLSWDPIVLKMGASWIGLIICVGLFATLVGCSNRFRQVSPIAADLLKPCLAWAAYLTFVNYKLI
ncbi:Translocator protein-like protein [Thalictrum thalictroides]|uniref:Translocator protein-like protein n=1 Tax=Thalictrum thalictroides TaxID=46969 RepID=A0A7J6XC29_THATH|nr:Translocator protein-like protein [Thalictrum thalictroides]